MKAWFETTDDSPEQEAAMWVAITKFDEFIHSLSDDWPLEINISGTAGDVKKWLRRKE